MSISSIKRNEIKQTIIAQIHDLNGDLRVKDIADEFHVSRTTIYRYVNELLTEHIIDKKTVESDSQFSLVMLGSFSHTYDNIDLQEDIVWRKDIHPLLKDIPQTAYRACEYAFTEIMNNAIEHSESKTIQVIVGLDAYSVLMQIQDFGVGIFAKIQKTLNLEEKSFAVLELAKGKFTSDPQSHTGEGIFFTSKVTDFFRIRSDDISFIGGTENNHSFLFSKQEDKKGTTVLMNVKVNRTITVGEIMDQYTQAPDDYGFSKTVVPVKLLEYGGVNPVFVSRSQARRLMMHFDQFETVMLDFEGVEDIGQGFADEVFRVFKNQHPGIEVIPIHCNKSVNNMILHVTKNQ